jgi:hypothetical protein
MRDELKARIVISLLRRNSVVSHAKASKNLHDSNSSNQNGGERGVKRKLFKDFHQSGDASVVVSTMVVPAM